MGSFNSALLQRIANPTALDLPNPVESRNRVQQSQMNGIALQNAVQGQQDQATQRQLGQQIMEILNQNEGDLAKSMPMLAKILPPPLLMEYQKLVDGQQDRGIARQVGARTAADQNFKFMEGAPGLPTGAAPANLEPGAQGPIQPMEQPHPEQTLPGIEAYGIGPVTRRPRTQEELLNQERAKAGQTQADAMARIREQQRAEAEFATPVKPAAPVAGRDFPLPADVEAQRSRMNASRAQQDGLSPQQFSKVQSLASQFDSNGVVKDFNVSAGKYQTVKGLIDADLGGPGDLAIVFEFMKGLDPTSVVRETEYATAAKSGNIFKGALARFNGYFKE